MATVFGGDGQVEQFRAAARAGHCGGPGAVRVRAVIRVTGGNFRLLHRLLAQVERILEINELDQVTYAVVETARGSLVIEQAFPCQLKFSLSYL